MRIDRVGVREKVEEATGNSEEGWGRGRVDIDLRYSEHVSRI